MSDPVDVPDEFTPDAIRARFAAEEARFRYAIDEGTCECRSCMDALRHLGAAVFTQTGQILAEVASEAVQAFIDRRAAREAAAAVADLQARLDTIEDLIRPVVMGEKSNGALAIRLQRLEERA